MMSIRLAGLLLLSLFTLNQVLGSPLMEERDLRALEKRRLLNEVEVEEDIEEEERRLQDEDIYNEVAKLLASARKRQIRQTPAPQPVRYKMTPGPGAPEGIFRLPATPAPGIVHLRTTPPAPANPYNIDTSNLRQTPKPLRLTPAPPQGIPGYPRETQWNWKDYMMKREMARREMEEMEEMERMRRLEMEVFDGY